MNGFLRGEPGDDVFGVRPARHETRADERGGLDLVQAGLGERLNQLDLVRGADRAGFDLEPFARAFLMDFNMCRQIGHGLVPRWEWEASPAPLYVSSPSGKTAKRCRRR